MEVLTSAKRLIALSKKWKQEGKSVGFVPTMGALHAGHLSLVAKSKTENDLTVVSIFVNPNQFNKLSDLENYPRTFDRDKEMLELAEADLLFFPGVDEIYPEPDLRRFNFGKLEKVMEGEFRPGHFNGVAQVVSRLFDIVQPSKAYFGEKDFQQLAVVKALVKQLNLPVEIVSCPTFREKNGLAMSSRNERLSEEGKKKAAIIFKILKEIQVNLPALPVDLVKSNALNLFEEYGFLELEYLEIAYADTLEKATHIEEGKHYVICIAAWMEGVRLIDNLKFPE
jgi:pantoate--beta-alanine ligase